MIIKPVELGQMAERNSVFIAYHTDPSHIYQSSPDCKSWGHDAWFSKIALLGIMVRWDGQMGLVGGKVDKDETLIQAACRESAEEIDFWPPEEMLKLVCSHYMKDGDFEQHTHVFSCKLTVEGLYSARERSINSPHGRVESAGFVAVHMTETAMGNLLKNSWAGTALEEVKFLINNQIVAYPTIEVNDVQLPK